MRVLLIDDHALFREGLALLMQARFPQVRLYQASDLVEATIILDGVSGIEFVLLDLDLGETRGLETLHRLHRVVSAAKVIVLSADDRPETTIGLFNAGADGFIPKTAREGRIADDLRSFFEGRSVDRQIAKVTRLASGVRSVSDAPSAASSALPQAPADTMADALDLSQRQLDVLIRLAEGKSNKQIGRELELAESTVKSHVLAIFRKLGVSSRVEATLQVTRLGLVPAPAWH